MTTRPYKVAFVGLPSSGKSTIINSLVHKRVAETGICRTTTEQKVVKDLIKDDDGNEFVIIDLPGMCDSEETSDNKFREMTYTSIAQANLIFWVSDVTKAFITTHEVTEFNKLRDHLSTLGRETSKLYDVAIILSKCGEKYDEDTIQWNSDDSDDDEAKNDNSDNEKEITTKREDTGISDIIKNVHNKFPTEIKIKIFNAHGRCYHHGNSTGVLKKFVKNLLGSAPSSNNTEFTITDFIKSYDTRSDTYCDTVFVEQFEDFLNSENAKYDLQSSRLKIINEKFDKITGKFAKMSVTKRDIFAKKFCVTNYNKKFYYGLFKFNMFIHENYPKYIVLLDIRCNVIFFLIHILHGNNYSLPDNLMADYKDAENVCGNIKKYFTEMNNADRKEVYQLIKLIINDTVNGGNLKFIRDSLYHYKLVMLLHNVCDIQTSAYCYTMIKQLFNEYANRLATDTTIALKFFDIIHTWTKEYMDTYLKFVPSAFESTESISKYFELFEKRASSNYYILLNKIEAIYTMLKKISEIPITVHYKYIITSDNPIFKRIAITDHFEELVRKTMLQIYENIEYPVKIDRISDIVPLSYTELLYKNV